MTDNEIIIAVAKLDGTLADFGDISNESLLKCVWLDKQKNQWLQWPIKPDGEITSLPNYLLSRDAIIPVIEKFDITTKCLVASNLQRGLHKHMTEPWLLIDLANCIIATPKQLCIALLKATGTYHE